MQKQLFKALNKNAIWIQKIKINKKARHEAKPIVPQILFYFTFLSLLPLKLAIRKT